MLYFFVTKFTSVATLYRAKWELKAENLNTSKRKQMNRLAFGIALTLLLGISGAFAQGYPSRPITMVVPFAAGGPSDVVARILSDRLRTSLGQPFVIENLAGGGGSIGMGRVARASPDGYTIGLGSWSTNIVNGAIHNLQYDVLNDFEPVILLPTNPLFIASNSSIPASDLKQLVSWLKANQDKVAVGTSGAGTSPHVAGVMLQKLTDTRLQLVHYRGGAPAIQDLISGQIHLFMNQASSFLPHLEGGRLRVYAVLAKERLPQAPDVPTVDEAGLPGFYLSSWNGIWAPKGTPKVVIDRLNAAFVDALSNESVRKRFIDLGQVIPTAEQLSPDAFAAYHKVEFDKWTPIVKAANISEN
jgi:tripartite-type tricarboxylate transporter receptor subunit TctC